VFTCVGLGYGLFCTERIQILPIPPSFFLEVYWPAQSSNSQVGKKTRGLVAKATSSLLCTHQTKPFRGFLRERFNLRRFTERRNPWTFGDYVFHMISRYSCQHSHFWYLQVLSSTTFFNFHNLPLLTIEKKIYFFCTDTHLLRVHFAYPDKPPTGLRWEYYNCRACNYCIIAYGGCFQGLVASVKRLRPDTFSVPWSYTSELLRLL